MNNSKIDKDIDNKINGEKNNKKNKIFKSISVDKNDDDKNNKVIIGMNQLDLWGLIFL